MMECSFCKKFFSNNANLRRHQKTVASCIELQGAILDENICDYCNKSYTAKGSLSRHLSNCKTKRKLETKDDIIKIKVKCSKKISDLKKSHEKEKLETIEIIKVLNGKNKNLTKTIEEKDLELKIKDEEIMALKIKCGTSKADGKVEVYDKVCTKVLDKSTVTNNTAYIHPKLVNLPITTIHPLTEDYVKKRVANGEYTFDHYRRGEDGIVDFINSITMCENDNGVVERNYVTTDTSRDSFHRLVETKEWEKDKGGKFIDVILDTLNDRVDNYHNQLLDERIKYKDSKSPGGYDPDTVYKRNNDMHSGVVQTHGKDRRNLRKKIKKETSTKVAV